jgi:hypothetical protein
VAGEIGVDAADRHRIGLLLRRAGGPEQRRADARETVGLDHRHGNFLTLNARARRVLLVAAAGMLSKRRRQGKRGNILLAMRRHGPRGFGISPRKIRMLSAGPARAGGMADKS